MIGWWLCLAAALLSAAQSRSAKVKLDRIAAGKLAPGATVVLTEEEINSYLRYDYSEEIPAGLSDPHIRMDQGRVAGDVQVDFAEWKAAKGESPGMLLGFLLRGKKRVDVVARWKSGEGRGQVDIEQVKIAGTPLSAAVVTFLIENLVEPRYPEAVVGRPVEWGYGMREVRIERGRTVVVMGGENQVKGQE